MVVHMAVSGRGAAAFSQWEEVRTPVHVVQSPGLLCWHELLCLIKGAICNNEMLIKKCACVCVCHWCVHVCVCVCVGACACVLPL